MREWIDGRFRWLQDQFGRDTLADVRVVLPTPEFFPDSYGGVPDDARVMLDRVAGYMRVDPRAVKLMLYSESDAPPLSGAGIGTISGSAGFYSPGDPDGANDEDAGRATIGIEEGQLADPLALVATLAHEIGHELLIGQGRVSADDPDHEPLTDLLTVFLGMGIFTANSTIRDRGWSSGVWAGWKTQRLGYLDQRAFGYALARFATDRGEAAPAWVKHVRPDVRAPLREALRFLSAAPL